MIYALKMLHPHMIVIDDSSLPVIEEAIDCVKDLESVPIVYTKSQVRKIMEQGDELDLRDTISVSKEFNFKTKHNNHCPLSTG